MSIENSKVITAFVKAQLTFGRLTKDKANPFFKSKYADLANCFDVVLEPLNTNGIAVLQVVHPADAMSVSIETLLVHESGQQLSSGVLTMPVKDLTAQGFGSAMTYARRYTLMAVCGLAPEDDDGNLASKKPEQKQAPAQPKKLVLNDVQLQRAIDRIVSKESTIENLEKACDLTDIQRSQIKYAVKLAIESEA